MGTTRMRSSPEEDEDDDEDDDENFSVDFIVEVVPLWLQKQKPTLRFVPVYGITAFHWGTIVLNFVLASFFTVNCWQHRHEMDRLVDKVFEIQGKEQVGLSCEERCQELDLFVSKVREHSGPGRHLPRGDSSSGRSILHELADFLNTLDAKPESHKNAVPPPPTSMLPRLLAKVMAAFSALACFIGCLDMMFARRFLNNDVLRQMFLEVQVTGKNNIVDNPSAGTFRSLEESLPREVLLNVMLGISAGVGMCIILFFICLHYHMELGIYINFMVPWMLSVSMRRATVHVASCVLQIAMAKIDMLCKEFDQLRTAGIPPGDLPEGYFTDKVKQYWTLDRQLMTLCNTATNTVLSTLSMTCVGAYCTVMAIFLTNRKGFKFALVMLTCGFMVNLCEILWPFARLSDRCCSPSKQLSVLSLRTEILHCSALKFSDSQTQEYLKLVSVVESSPVGAKLPLLGLITTADLIFFAKLALTTLPTSVAWILTSA